MEERAGDWSLGRVVSAGTLAEVREAVPAGGGPAVAIKRLHHHAARDPAVRALFVAEHALTCAVAPHPHLVRGRGGSPDGARPFLVLDLIAGIDLRARIAAGGLARGEALALVAGAAAGAAHLHAAGWVHGDLCPANLLCGPRGAVVCDLGVARRVGEAGPVRGTAAYMAPEQVRGEAWTGALDCFALGVVAWELLRGARLFRRGQDFLSMAAVVEERPPRLDDPLAELIAAALAPVAGDRPSAAELAAQLGRAAEAAGAKPG